MGCQDKTLKAKKAIYIAPSLSAGNSSRFRRNNIGPLELLTATLVKVMRADPQEQPMGPRN